MVGGPVDALELKEGRGLLPQARTWQFLGSESFETRDSFDAVERLIGSRAVFKMGGFKSFNKKHAHLMN
jgi:hypothetical protein